MESLRNNPSHKAPSQTVSDGLSSPTQTSWVRPDSGSGVTANQIDQMPISALTSPLIPQAAPPFAHEHPVDFQHPGSLAPEANSWRSTTSARMFPPSSTNPQQQHRLEGYHPTLGVAYLLSPFAAPSQDHLSFYQPGCTSEASNTTNILMTPLILSQTMLPPASPIMPCPANTNTTERARSIRDDGEWTRHKDSIWKLYVKENRTLEATMTIMKEDYGFVAE